MVEDAEHIAKVLVEFSGLVGSEHVGATPDCGFETFVGLGMLAPSIIRLKLQRMQEGAALARLARAAA